MSLPNPNTFGIIENPLVFTPFGDSDNPGSNVPHDEFLLLNTQPFMLLSNQQFTLLQ